MNLLTTLKNVHKNKKKAQNPQNQTLEVSKARDLTILITHGYFRDYFVQKELGFQEYVNVPYGYIQTKSNIACNA